MSQFDSNVHINNNRQAKLQLSNIWILININPFWNAIALIY